MQQGLSICLNALLIHILCVQKHVYILFWKQIQTQDSDNIKEDVAEIYLQLFIYDKYINIVCSCSDLVD